MHSVTSGGRVTQLILIKDGLPPREAHNAENGLFEMEEHADENFGVRMPL